MIVELIDTLWNVNMRGKHPLSRNTVRELIDTLWNVNFKGF